MNKLQDSLLKQTSTCLELVPDIAPFGIVSGNLVKGKPFHFRIIVRYVSRCYYWLFDKLSPTPHPNIDSVRRLNRRRERRYFKNLTRALEEKLEWETSIETFIPFTSKLFETVTWHIIKHIQFFLLSICVYSAVIQWENLKTIILSPYHIKVSAMGEATLHYVGWDIGGHHC